MPTPFTFPADFVSKPGVLPGAKQLDGVTYRFRFWANVRAAFGRGAWCVDLFNAKLEPRVRGVKLIVTDDLFADFRGTVQDIPPGRIVVRRTDGVDEDPRPTTKADVEAARLVATLGSPLLVVEYVSVAEDAAG